MKKQSNTLFAKFSGETLAKLTMEVKETLAPGFDIPQKKFTTADLWNIQRNKKKIAIRRYSF